VAPAIPRHAGLVPASAEPLAISLGARRTPAQGRGDDGEKARRRAIRFAGYAAVFDRIDRGGDVVRAGAFRLPAAVPLLWQHRGQPVGRIEWVEEDATGLRVIGAIDDPQLAALVAAKAIDGLSFGYRVRTARSGRVRELTDLDLVEISLVARPMQPLARVHAVEENDMSNP
jgi:hypothetical protein